jgi:hypothetical protein
MELLDSLNRNVNIHPEWNALPNKFVLWLTSTPSEEYKFRKLSEDNCYEVEISNDDILKLSNITKRAISVFQHRDGRNDLLYIHPGMLHNLTDGEHLIDTNQSISYLPERNPNFFYIILEI